MTHSYLQLFAVLNLCRSSNSCSFPLLHQLRLKPDQCHFHPCTPFLLSVCLPHTNSFTLWRDERCKVQHFTPKSSLSPAAPLTCSQVPALRHNPPVRPAACCSWALLQRSTSLTRYTMGLKSFFEKRDIKSSGYWYWSICFPAMNAHFQPQRTGITPAISVS